MRLLIAFLLLLTIPRPGHAQAVPPADSPLTLRQADSLFLRNNLLLLAERFRIDASQAQVLQASLYDNPTVAVELSTYNPETRRTLDVGRQGQKIVSVQQLLYTAGKRNKRVALASEATRLTEYELLDLLRGLRFDLRSRFYAIYFQQQTLSRFEQQISTLQTTVSAYEVQYKRNNVSLRELLRLKALLFELNNQRTAIRFQLADDQQQLQTLLSITTPVRPVVTDETLTRYRLPLVSDDSLRQQALRSRPDLRAAESLARQAELNYTLQRALAVPDLRVGGIYDQAGSYVPNYVGVSVSADLPVFNRNQGAIRAAKSQIGYQRELQRQRAIQVSNEVDAVLTKVREVEGRMQSMESQFAEQFEQLNRGVVVSFQKGNLSLIEFVDLIEAYNDSVQQLNRLKADRVSAYEELNYLVGQELYPINPTPTPPR